MVMAVWVVVPETSYWATAAASEAAAAATTRGRKPAECILSDGVCDDERAQ